MFDPISWSFSWPYYAMALAGGYMLGAIPFGLLLTRAAGLGDIRAIGSGNIGATNVLRTGRKDIAILTLLLDGLKGTLAVWLGFLWGGPTLMILGGLGAFLGHLFPVWLKFKGGKGVATFLGVAIGFHAGLGAAVAGCWLLVAFVTRISSLSALVAALAAPFIAWAMMGPHIAQALGLMTVFVFIRHHENIRRLLRGEEPKIGAKKNTPA